MSDHATIKDVAKKAGVSITTVSFVLNNRPDVAISQEVRRKVLESARSLDYHPSAMAAGLAGKRTRNLGVVFSMGEQTLVNPFYAIVVEGIARAIAGKPYNLMFAYLEGACQGPPSLPKFVREKNTDGVILVGRVETRMVADLLDKRTPVVLIDNFPRMEGVNCVQIDNHRGGMLAAAHLNQLGHKNIILFTAGGHAKRASIQEREEGFALGLEEAGLKLTDENTVDCINLSFYSAYEKTLELFKRVKKPLAIFAVNDEMAAGVIRAAVEAGRTVPGDLSVVGFDNILMSNYTAIPLTTISVAKEHLGRMAAERVIEMVEAKDRTVKRELAPVELIVRSSTGKPGA
jgi:LacI family transcriptional regulator